MAEITLIPLLHAQNQSISSLAHNMAVGPEAAQAMTSQLAMSLMRLESMQIHKPDPTNRANSVNDEEGNSCQSNGDKTRREHKKPTPEPEPEPTTNPNPMVGNLLNLKI